MICLSDVLLRIKHMKAEKYIRYEIHYNYESSVIVRAI